MPIFAIQKDERYRHHPDPDDQDGTWFDYRRITLETESEIDALCTDKKGLLDRFKKLNVLCAWGLVGWKGFAESAAGPEIPYDFPRNFEEDDALPSEWKYLSPEQQRKVAIVAKLPRFLKADITNAMTATLAKQDTDLKNSASGLLAESV